MPLTSFLSTRWLSRLWMCSICTLFRRHKGRLWLLIVLQTKSNMNLMEKLVKYAVGKQSNAAEGVKQTVSWSTCDEALLIKPSIDFLDSHKALCALPNSDWDCKTWLEHPSLLNLCLYSVGAELYGRLGVSTYTSFSITSLSFDELNDHLNNFAFSISIYCF